MARESSNLADSLDILQCYILAILGARNKEPVRERLWLQKEVFLIANTNRKLADASGFAPHLQGPFSESVEAALADLKSLGLVSYDEYGGQIQLTRAGEGEYERLAEDMPSKVKDQVEDIKDSFNDLTENELLVFIYYSYPEMTAESVLIRKAQENRIPCAASLYRKGKVSLEKAAEIAGMNLLDFRTRVGGEEHRS
jgi:predicted HTH domain antitoxin